MGGDTGGSLNVNESYNDFMAKHYAAVEQEELVFTLIASVIAIVFAGTTAFCRQWMMIPSMLAMAWLAFSSYRRWRSQRARRVLHALAAPDNIPELDVMVSVGPWTVIK